MKKLHFSSLVLGAIIGLVLASMVHFVQPARAQESTEQKKSALTDEEVDKRLDEILESQKELRKKLETIATQTRFLKASAGK